jgi:hypothetical protein
LTCGGQRRLCTIDTVAIAHIPRHAVALLKIDISPLQLTFQTGLTFGFKVDTAGIVYSFFALNMAKHAPMLWQVGIIMKKYAFTIFERNKSQRSLTVVKYHQKVIQLFAIETD